MENSRQLQTRLSASNRRELLAAYTAGAPVQELAARFGVHRGTVWAVVRRAGLHARTPTVPVEKREEAARLYEEGLTLAQVAARLGIGDETVRAAVVVTGGVVRPRGRPRIQL